MLDQPACCCCVDTRATSVSEVRFADFSGFEIERRCGLISPNMRSLLCVALLAVLMSPSSAQARSAEDSYVINTVSNDIWPRGIAIGSAGEIYVTSGKHQIFRSYDGQAFTVIAGKDHPPTFCCVDPSYPPAPLFSGDGGPAIDAYLDTPEGIAIASDGTIYFADSRNHRIRRVLKSGIIETVAGTGQAAFGGDDGPALTPRSITQGDLRSTSRTISILRIGEITGFE
jgi:hypothetical protein